MVPVACPQRWPWARQALLHWQLPQEQPVPRVGPPCMEPAHPFLSGLPLFLQGLHWEVTFLFQVPNSWSLL